MDNKRSLLTIWPFLLKTIGLRFNKLMNFGKRSRHTCECRTALEKVHYICLSEDFSIDDMLEQIPEICEAALKPRAQILFDMYGGY